MTSKDKRMLDATRLEFIEEDLPLLKPDSRICIMCKLINEERYFIDYEIAETDPAKYRELLPEELKERFDEAEKHRLSDICNIVYLDEIIDVVTPKEFIYIITDLEYPEYSSEIKAILVNLWMNEMTPYALAQKIGVSKQFISLILNGYKLPQKRAEQIAEALGFEMYEYLREPSEYKYDSTK